MNIINLFLCNVVLLLAYKKFNNPTIFSYVKLLESVDLCLLCRFVALSNNEKTSFKARELKSVHVDAVGHFVKFVIHKNHLNTLNVYNQVKHFHIILHVVIIKYCYRISVIPHAIFSLLPGVNIYKNIVFLSQKFNFHRYKIYLILCFLGNQVEQLTINCQ